MRNTSSERGCDYCFGRYGLVYDANTKKLVAHPKVNLAYWVINSIHPEREGRIRAYCVSCINDIESDGTSLQEQLVFGATYTHGLSTGEG